MKHCFDLNNITLKLVVLLSLFLLRPDASLAYEKYLVSYLTVKDGLSQNEVTSIIKDKYGFLWFGTRGGLNRYDGYVFNHFKPGYELNKGLNNPSVERLFLDSRGNIWIGTKSGGITLYDTREESFTQITDSLHSLPQRVISFYEDRNRNVWIGSWHRGVWSYSLKTGSFNHFLVNDRVNSVVQTPDGTIWCGTNNGLRFKNDSGQFKWFSFGLKAAEITRMIDDEDEHVLWMVGWGLHLIRFNYQDMTFEQFRLPIKDRSVFSNAYSLFMDRDKNIWVGTWGNGLFRFDKQKKRFRKVHIKPELLDEDIRTDYDVILDIFQDIDGEIWIGTDGGGIVKLSERNNFNVIHSFEGNRFAKRHVNTILIDSDNDFWVGTKGEGLFYLNDDKTFSKVYAGEKSGLSDRSFLVVKYLYEDTLKNIWASFNKGLYVIVKRNNRPELIKAAEYFDSPDLNKIRKAHYLVLNKDGLWIGTQQNGLFLFKRKNDKFIIEKHFVKGKNANDIKSNRVTVFVSDKENNFWIGTYSGLFRYNRMDSSFVSIDSILHSDEFSLCNIILTLSVDNNDNLWIGTPCCLSKLSKNSSGGYDYERYNKHNGLPDDYINGILPDEEGNIWITTNVGISKLDPVTGEIRNYFENDGVGDSNFSEGASFRSKDRTLYFGGYTGVTYFKPSDIIENKIIPEIVITDFKILNKEVPIDRKGILPVTINEVKQLQFTYKEKEFSFEFAALDYRAPLRNRYAYKLDGFNDDWVYTGERRHISFNNLDPGKYILHLKGSNSSGYWNNEGKKIIIEVLPPPWKTWYALIVYIFIGFGLTFLVRWNAVRQERLQKRVEIEKLIREQEHEVSEMKLRFFTNVSHEFRTPLTLIVALLKDLKKEASALSADVAKKIDTAYNNAGRLMKLVNQLMEFRKTESGNLKLNMSYNDIDTFLYEISLPFEELASINNIKFIRKLRLKNKYCLFDPDKFEVVLNNLLSNAFKFTGKEGFVILSVEDTENEIIISIKDNGEGISGEEQKYIFERFYQTDEGVEKRGTGIGLALSKKYIEMHKGSITVNSERGKGTVFTVKIPRGKNEEVLNQNDPPLPYEVVHNRIKRNENYKVRIKEDKSVKVLVVEDNEEVRVYLKELFERYYTVITSVDGLEGYDIAREEQPDVIVSDVMMPGMDGYELCESIKKNERTNTIPVILLTAKTTEQYKMLGITKGADAYVSKPFDPDYLLVTVSNILKSLKRIENRFSKKVLLGPEKIEITKSEERLLVKVNELLEKNISDPEFDAKTLASDLNMSMATLYRKLKPLVNTTPAEYIRSFRIKRAANLLEDKDKTVTEIAFEVGFLDLKSFRAAFMKQFGKTPSKYRDNL